MFHVLQPNTTAVEHVTANRNLKHAEDKDHFVARISGLYLPAISLNILSTPRQAATILLSCQSASNV
jgi:hypothetical protein